jgi:hypothetical protein
MKELRRVSARLWTEADDDKLRALALTGASARTVAAVRSRICRLKITLIKSDRRRPDGPKVRATGRSR